ncbi:class I SAM-dependent methyltransferase [candidate division KSB1 bacterium]
MIRSYLKKFVKDPFGFIKRAFYKIVLGPLKYGKKDGYDATKYWNDRFSKYGYNLQGAGDESKSVEENEEMYREAGAAFEKILEEEKIDFSGIRVLEIGVGSAFYTEILNSKGVKNYTGIDITDVLFDQHKNKFPDYKFIKCDITEDNVEGEFDLIIMIDVSQHIVKKEKLISALNTIKKCIGDKGIYLIAPLTSESRKHHFYVHSWSPEFVKKHFAGYEFRDLEEFRGNRGLIIRKN